MTMPDPDAARKPPRRIWLFAPYIALIAGIALWSLAWLGIRAQVAARMDRALAVANLNGFDLNWKARQITGYPFRIEVTLEQPHVGEPSGWGLAAPRIKAIANAYDLNHWVVAAPQGLVLNRPAAGATVITGQAIRASWVQQGADAPRIVVEGLNVSFATAPNAKPFPLAKAARAAFYTRPAPGDQIEARLLLDNAWANPASRFGNVTGQTPIALIWQGLISHASAFHGADAPAAALSWSSAGGTVTTTLGGMAAGPRALGVQSSRLSTGPDGRLRGQALLQLKNGGDAARLLGVDLALDPTAAGAAADIIDARTGAGAKAAVDLTFQAGATTLGPIAVAPTPKLF